MKYKVIGPLLACALLGGCQSAPKPEAKAPAAATAPAAGWVKTELYFGLAPEEAEGLGLSAAEGTWRTFLAEEATPRFPDGFTVFDAYGQWRPDATAAIERVRGRVLVIVHPDAAEARAKIESLREAYKSRTGAKSVLGVETRTEPPRF